MRGGELATIIEGLFVTLAEYTSDHGKQTNSNTEECEWGGTSKLLRSCPWELLLKP